MKDRSDDSNGHSAGSDENRDETAKDMPRDFLDLQRDDCRGVLALRAIRDFCTTFAVC